jgi:hypothetical protein
MWWSRRIHQNQLLQSIARKIISRQRFPRKDKSKREKQKSKNSQAILKKKKLARILPLSRLFILKLKLRNKCLQKRANLHSRSTILSCRKFRINLQFFLLPKGLIKHVLSTKLSLLMNLSLNPLQPLLKHLLSLRKKQ